MTADLNSFNGLPRRRTLIASGIALALVTAGLSTAAMAAQPNIPVDLPIPEIATKAPRWAEGRILVQPRAGLPESELGRILNLHGGQAIERIQQIGVRMVNVPAGAEDAVVQALSRNPHIQFAEKDMIVELSEVIPNDPYYSKGWHLSKIQTPVAWDASLGNGVTVAILDTGVDSTHPDLVGQMIQGWNAVDGSQDTTDINGHGTAVAGTAAATTNNGIGVASVAGDATVMPIRVSNSSDGAAYWSDIAKGVTWAADRGAKVANISYQSVTASSAIGNAANYMNGKGGLVVVAAGNTGGDPGFSDSPYMISVSATTSSDVKASWSSYGYYIDVTAPGASIYTTKRGGSYGSWNGTSFSSPVTAGVVALIMAANSNLSPADVEAILKSTADDLGDPGWDIYYGYGRVNAAAAVLAASQVEATDTQVPSVSIMSPSGGVVSSVVAVDVSASDNVGVSKVDLYANNTLVASDNTEPFAFSWDTLNYADGSVSLVAHAFDVAGNKGISNSVTVTVDNVPDPVDTLAPKVAITSPSDGENVGRKVTIKANASDDIGVTKLSIYVNDKLMCVTSSSDLTCGWNTRRASSGTHTISARAEDAVGNKSTTSIQVVVGGQTSEGGGKGNGRNK